MLLGQIKTYNLMLIIFINRKYKNKIKEFLIK